MSASLLPLPPRRAKARCLAKLRAFLFTVCAPSRKRAFVIMILTCPNCGTQYVVKDGAIPPEGRQVRCAACKHSWHQGPDEGESDAPTAAVAQPTASEAIPPTAVEDHEEPDAEPESIAEATL